MESESAAISLNAELLRWSHYLVRHPYLAGMSILRAAYHDVTMLRSLSIPARRLTESSFPSNAADPTAFALWR